MEPLQLSNIIICFTGLQIVVNLSLQINEPLPYFVVVVVDMFFGGKPPFSRSVAML